jgi:hypothetical protein
VLEFLAFFGRGLALEQFATQLGQASRTLFGLLGALFGLFGTLLGLFLGPNDDLPGPGGRRAPST